MVALFSTLLSSSNETESPSSPTLIQLYSKKSVTFDPNAQVGGVLAYQALEATEPGETKLFDRSHKKSKGEITEPNLGVWNCLITTSQLVDGLLKIPEPTNNYCFTVDLSVPSSVEPQISLLHNALVRLLIHQSSTTGSTSLLALKKAHFGLAAKDKQTEAAAAESDENCKINLMICALLPTTVTTDYQETQAHNLVLYHLRKFAAEINATLLFIRPKETEELLSVPLEMMPFTWYQWCNNGSSAEITGLKKAYTPDNHQTDLIETILLRNAQCPGQWDAETDSLWKALPMKEEIEENIKKEKKGDDGWLQQLRDSVESATAPHTPKTKSSNSNSGGTEGTKKSKATPSSSKKGEADVSSFFENLLKK